MPLKDTPAEKLFESFTGHASPKKSRIITIHGNPDPLYRLKIKHLHEALKEASRTKRFKTSLFKKGKTTKHVAACPRRYLEFMGQPFGELEYISKPHLVGSPNRYIYELRVGYIPYCTFTDAKEAELCCIALQQYGYSTAYINQLDY